MMVRSIKDLIEGRALVSIERSATVTQACEKMTEHGVDALVVMDEVGMCGILSQRGVIRRCDAKGAPSELMRVDTIMTCRPQTLGLQDSLADAAQMMLDGGFRNVPVVEAGGDVVGMVSMRDIPSEYCEMVERLAAYQQRHAAE